MVTKVIGKVSPTPKGQYNSSIQYERLDIVTYQGGSYIAIQDTKGNVPTNTTYWNILAEKGSSITLSSYKNEYVLSDTSTQPQSGWSTTFPTIEAGKYLWTRTTLNTTGGSSIVSYNVAYQGVNGTGSGTVKSVNGTQPDASGNVEIDIGTNINVPVYNVGNSFNGTEIFCFGFITNSAQRMYLTLIFPKLFHTGAKIKIDNIFGMVRSSLGGYIEGENIDLTNYITNATIDSGDGKKIVDCDANSIQLILEKTSGNIKGFIRTQAPDSLITNNTTVSGYLYLTGTII